MTEEWNQVRELTADLTDDLRDQTRITNLAFAATLARRSRRLVGTADRSDRDGVQADVGRIALHKLPPLRKDLSAWNEIGRVAAQAVRNRVSRAEVDAWVAAFQSADPARKTRGAYATPNTLARELARATLSPFRGEVVRLVDPGAGCGALLLAAADFLSPAQSTLQRVEQAHSLYGVEMDPLARELCCLLVWLASPKEAKLRRIAANIVTDNALTRNWWMQSAAPFDAVIMNPPWESLRQTPSTEGSEVADRRASQERLKRTTEGAPGLPPLFTAQGTGDRNLYKAFLELAPHLLAPGARLGALIPAAFASDLGTMPLRRMYQDRFALEQWTSFENTQRLFPIDSRYKFGILVGSRTDAGTTTIRVRSFANDPRHSRSGHVLLSRDELTRLGGDTGMVPEVDSRRRMRILLRALRSGTSFFAGGALGTIGYQRELDLTLDRARGLFTRIEDRPDLAAHGDGTYVDASGREWAPLIEGRMVGQFDCFQKSWISGSGRTAVWQLNGERALSECRPQFVAPPRPANEPVARIAICDVTSATNTRTVIATWVPPKWTCGNTAPVLCFDSEELAFAGLAVLNSMIFDWLARQIVAGLHLNRFYLATLAWPTLSPDAIRRLASAGVALSRANLRFPGPVDLPFGEACAYGADLLSIRAGVEREVARGYSLTYSMVREILDPAPTDRRGFWRYYDAEPSALAVAELAAGSGT